MHVDVVVDHGGSGRRVVAVAAPAVAGRPRELAGDHLLERQRLPRRQNTLRLDRVFSQKPDSVGDPAVVVPVRFSHQDQPYADGRTGRRCRSSACASGGTKCNVAGPVASSRDRSRQRLAAARPAAPSAPRNWVVTPVTMGTSMASHQASTVARSRSVSSMFAASLKTPRRILCSCASAREPLATSRRSCSLTHRAMPISSVGSSAHRVALSRASAPADSVLPARAAAGWSRPGSQLGHGGPSAPGSPVAARR